MSFLVVRRVAPFPSVFTRSLPALSLQMTSSQSFFPRASFSTQSAPAMTKPNRPTSPHVSIYAFPLPAISSIANRATGAALAAGISGMALVALTGNCDIPAYLDCVKTSVPFAMPVIKMVVAFPIVYHSLGGARHLFWDATVKGLDLQSVELSTKVLFASAGVLTLLLGFYTIPALK